MSRRIYQRQIPYFIASVLVGLLLVVYFANYAPLNQVGQELTTWSTIISLFIGFYATSITVILNVRRIMSIKDFRNKTFQASSIAILTLAFFLLLGITIKPDSTMFSDIYKYTVLYASSSINIPWSLGGLYYVYRYMRPGTLESAILFIFFIFTYLRGITAIVAIYPPLYNIAYWIETVPAVGVIRTFVISAAVGTTIMGIRVLVGKETGIMEMEME